MNDALRRKVSGLPAGPGVYLFRDAAGKVVYVGKAGNLRQRVRDGLARIGDLERLLARAVLGSLTPREAAALRDSLEATPAILVELASSLRPWTRSSIAAAPSIATASSTCSSSSAESASAPESAR